jgi:acetoin utilization deacetylase AcuC-like enzyme
MQVFYRPEQSVTVQSASPSAGKPAQVVADWRERFGARLDFVSFEPVTREDYYRIHDRAYVDGVFTLERSNGFGTRQAEVVETLRYTSGSMRAAALAAWQCGGVTVSPTSGFHHAGYGYGGGYCTFNGLVLAALAVLDAGARQIAIIDCDYHYGDGTHDILLRLDLYDQVRHWTLGAHSKGNERQVLARLEAALAETLAGSELVIYQAGADSHEDDPLGGVFSTEGYRERDRLVFEATARAGVPVAWNLAGGYQEPLRKVLELHAITMGEALAAEGVYGQLAAHAVQKR